MANPVTDDPLADAVPAMPLHLGHPDDFARVRSFLEAAGFRSDAICLALRIESLADLPLAAAREPVSGEGVSAALAVLIRLFLSGKPVSAAQVREAVDSGALEAMERLGLVRSEGADGGGLFSSPVCLYPVEGLLIASDFYPDGAPERSVVSELVYPAFSSGTLRFLQLISREPAADALDLCSGSGVAALLLGRSVARPVAVDITARSTHFARFNCLLNGAEHVKVLQGNLYEPVGERRFDRIVAHPPYVPSLTDEVVWRDGGETGEEVLRAIVQGLPIHLHPGGTFCGRVLGMDTREGTFEERIRRWLGEAESEFDVLFAQGRSWSPRELAVDLAIQQTDGGGEVAAWERRFRDLGVRQAARGALAICRRRPEEVASGSAPLTLRTKLSDATDAAFLDWVVRWHRWTRRPEAEAVLAAMRPRPAPHLQVTITHSVQDGRLVPARCVLRSDRPFRAEVQVDAPILEFMLRCDGSRTVAELHQETGEDGARTLQEVVGLVAVMLSHGYLTVDGEWSLPTT